jgi:hypothetical protein
MGYQVNSRFLRALREASLRQRWTFSLALDLKE